MYVSSLCLSILLMAQLTSCYPTGAGLTGAGLTGAGLTGAGLTGAGLTGTGRASALELQDLLDRLESLVEQREVEGPVEGPVLRREEVSAPRGGQRTEEDGAAAAVDEDLNVALIRELLSPQNLMSVRNNNNNSPRSSSGCFGRRMDRIGSMSSLGCNTVGKNSQKSA
ncbi:natriuretic peptides B [Boleophthalmus pectinirostris]|uniref:natriuretic peptides B n=1 Tax=Boleophthalmus pectinirostris TaxID=150288 RepID=UPI00242D6202|nr:natriuretic peptides B [Boleophthalmus pectinirostris]